MGIRSEETHPSFQTARSSREAGRAGHHHSIGRDGMNQPGAFPDFREDCPCPKKKCERRGRCAECRGHHALKGKLPFCLRKNR